MEDTTKKQYFRFYQHGQINSNSRVKHQTSKYQGLKPLPHISEEYHYQITNHLLINKIINPRRDKIIMHSLDNLKGNHSRQHSRNNSRDQKWRTTQHRSLHSSQKSKQTTKIIDNHTQSITNKAKRNNIGKVVFNRFREGPYNPINSDLTQHSKENLQPKSFRRLPQSRSFRRLKQSHSRHDLTSISFINPSLGFGSGSTVLKILDLKIEDNPPIKKDTMIQVELIERTAFKKEVQTITIEKKEKTIKSTPMEYSDLPSLHKPNSAIKFCLNLHKIGDFVPLRIWKYTGVQSSLVGSVDLPLVSFGDEDEGQGNEGGEVLQKTIMEYKKQDETYSRKAILGSIARRLVKVKMQQSEARVFLKYKVYPKRFQKTSHELSDSD